MFLSENTFTFLFLIAVFTPAQQRIIYMLSDSQQFTKCPVEDCYNFRVLINNGLLLGDISNTMIVFQSGTHTISSAVNKIISINSATNLTLRAANSLTSTGATVKCNGFIGFTFRYISGLNISGITFDTCDGVTKSNHPDGTGSDIETFSLSIVYSYNVTLKTVTIKRGKGNGLLVRCVYGYFVLSQTNLTMNNINLNIIIEDDENASPTSSTIISITDSVFSYGQLTTPFCNYSSGMILRLLLENATTFFGVKLVNITSNENLNCFDNCNNINMYIKFNIFTTSIMIKNYTSTYDPVTRPKHNNLSLIHI